MNKHWDLVDLRIFCEVVRRGSFVAAASQLGISAAYVTKRIANFEHQIGHRLFHRTTRRVLISEAGEKAYQWATQVLEAANSFDECMATTPDAPSGKLRITTSLRLARKHLAPILGLMREKYPLLEVWLEAIYRRVDLLAEGVDIDIRMENVSEPHLIAHPLMENVRILCAAPAYLARKGTPQSLADLADHDCLLYRDFHQTFGLWHMQGPNGAESVRVSGPMGSNHSDIVWNWTKQGFGISLYSSWDISEDLACGELVRVLPEYSQPANLIAVTAARTENSAKLQTCLTFIREQLKEGPYALKMAD